MPLPSEVQRQLDEASTRLGRIKMAQLVVLFESRICGNEWDRFVENAATKCYAFVQDCLGPFHKEPQPAILTVEDGSHSSGANASFQPDNGQIRLCPDYVVGRAGTTLEKVCHELLHANLDGFPEGDPFYEEGYVDFSVWVIAHAPYWGEHRDSMIRAASHNIALRRDRAMKDLSDYDRKRWGGGLFCSTFHGPWILSKLRMRKAEGDLRW